MGKQKNNDLPAEIQNFVGVESLVDTYKRLALNHNPDVIKISKEISKIAFENYCIYWKEATNSKDSLLHF